MRASSPPPPPLPRLDTVCTAHGVPDLRRAAASWPDVVTRRTVLPLSARRLDGARQPVGQGRFVVSDFREKKGAPTFFGRRF